MNLAELIMILATLVISIAVLYLINALICVRNKKNNISAILKDFGLYDSEQDIFFLALDSRRRKYGQCLRYDEAAPRYGIITDNEPIQFEYEGKKWLIEFWKGQYGGFTAGEAGVYTTKNQDHAGSYDKTFYDSTEAGDHLQMEITLLKSERVLFHRKDTHWRLSGFIPGEFSKPSELTMEIKIKFKTTEMRKRFTEALNRAGYSRDEYKIKKRSVNLTFDKPRSLTQPKDTTVIQALNIELCNQYTNIEGSFANSLEKLIYIRVHEPKLYSKLLKPWRLKK